MTWCTQTSSKFFKVIISTWLIILHFSWKQQLLQRKLFHRMLTRKLRSFVQKFYCYTHWISRNKVSCFVELGRRKQMSTTESLSGMLKPKGASINYIKTWPKYVWFEIFQLYLQPVHIKLWQIQLDKKYLEKYWGYFLKNNFTISY